MTEDEEVKETDFVSPLRSSSDSSDLSARNRDQNPHESLIISIFGIPIKLMRMFFLLKKKTVLRCLGCKFIHFIYMLMYLHVYLICTQGPKMLSEKCCLSYVFPLYCISY